MIELFKQLPRWLRLSLVFPLLFLNGWLLFQLFSYLEPLVSIFVTASLLAFVLDVPIKLLQRRGVNRSGSIAIVFLIALLILIVLGLILIPQIVEQLSSLINSLPQWIESGTEQIQNLEKWDKTQKYAIYIEQSITQLSERLTNVLQTLSTQLLSFVLGTINSILNILFVLVLTVFLVLYGEQIWEGIFSWIPSPWNFKLRTIIRQTFETYFAGQTILAGILSLAQIFVFVILKVDYALLFGVAIGLTTLIPFASAFTIIGISTLLMFQDFWLGLKVLTLTIIVGQINDNVIAPRLMGGMIGLNPVWIILSLFIGGKVAGILGLLIAVPIASVLKSTIDIIRSQQREKEPVVILEETVKNSSEESK
ncbi:MAG: AI-2E family transporter [Microcystis aeruginosa L111-01]|nr:AI-2E family transporter [Microcystis aeruginosa W13-16]NCQ75215.1 AI-2E family transporter [Microcystis aeruginosa W13-13]NCQ79642.1 AI-2E family transporter [Microcystis aeruginosa W13-15]NCR23424.1 AI-2E family transporter [Microcystis aeruginosa L111-01]NCS44941.1 AI-2E family transporter [Microcystis aeruginosa BS11-05]NCS53452.1 AI-2E family transporter [Microcystis aeruginosa G13-05]